MNLFVLDERCGVTVTKFIDYWKERYYQYTDVSDSIYWKVYYSIKNNNVKKEIELMGAWKTGAISLRGKEGLAFECPCPRGAKYRYTGRWKTGTPAGYDVWVSLSDRINNDRTRLENPEEIAELIEELRIKTYNGPRSPLTKFSLTYLITYLHFLDPEKYPIFDSFANRAVEYIFSEQRPEIPFKLSNSDKVKNFKEYKNGFMSKFNKLKEDYKPQEENIDETKKIRNIDKALWAFGHYIWGSAMKKNKACCEP